MQEAQITMQAPLQTLPQRSLIKANEKSQKPSPKKVQIAMLNCLWAFRNAMRRTD